MLSRVPLVRQALVALREAASLARSSRVLVHGGSMEPGLRDGDRVAVLSTGFRRGGPDAGDVVLLRDPERPHLDTVKRVVAVPGEQVCLRGGRVYVDGRALREPYVAPGEHGRVVEEGAWSLGPHDYFVLGDHRDGSRDSRAYGPVRRERLIGRVWYRYGPGSARGAIPPARREFDDS